MILIQTSTIFHMSQRPTAYWNGWLTADGFERKMYFWIMEPEKGVCAFFCPIRQNAAPLESNMKNGSLPGQKKINAMRYPASEPHLQ